MKSLHTTTLKPLLLLLILALQLFFLSPHTAFAATTPSLGLAASFGILSSTYTNTVAGTTITGDLGYTTGPAVNPTVSGTTYAASGIYNQAGIDQGAALTNLNAQPCTFTFAPGAIDLATDTTHGTLGVYTPGVYCTAASSAASIGTAGITLSGSGTYIFRINGAFTTVANSVVSLSGASACDVFWTPTAATTLGANSTFAGTNIDASGITIGSTILWTGRALAFGGTVSTTTDTITAPTCPVATATPTPTSTSSLTSTPTPIAASATSSPSSPRAGVAGSAAIAPCIASPITSVPLILTSTRRSPSSIFITWGPYAGTTTFSIRYGLSNGNWLYNTRVTGFSTTLNALPLNQPIWVEVAAANNCAIGSFSSPLLVAGIIPLLPNTGFPPHNISSTWYIPTNIFVLSSFLLKLIYG